MNIMVFNVPAESVGALSILSDFYNEIKNDDNSKINWFFVLSKIDLIETENIKVLKYPWIKKNWLNRTFFDYIIAPGLIKKYDISKVISFQNIIIPRTKVKQTLYVHNALPFVQHKFSIIKNKKLWIYQNIIGSQIISSIKKADKVFVQTNWMKEECIKKAKVSEMKIKVVPPKIEDEILEVFKPALMEIPTFFYPASEFSYKNHKIIVESCKLLKEMGILNYNVIFTLKGDETKDIEILRAEIDKLKLPIRFVGFISRKEVFNYYSKTVLLFPSYIETFGLPLLEARMHKGIIVASNCSFSYEILKNYENSFFFDPFKADQLMRIMKSLITQNLNYVSPIDKDYNFRDSSLYKYMLQEKM